MDHAPSDTQILCDLLNADSLDDLIRIAQTRAQTTTDFHQLLVVSWSSFQLGPWSVYPDAESNLRLGSELEKRWSRGRPDDSARLDEESRRRLANSIGFDGMAVIGTRTGPSYHVYWSGPSGDRSSDLSATPLWRDLEIALCNFARLERLRELSHIDTLTGLFNRRYFNLRLLEEVARAERFNRPLALAVADLDRFKPLNDEHGHQAGDVVLRYLAQALKRAVRSIDIVCRIGGDEFAVLMPDTDGSDCSVLGERLCQTVASGSFTLRNREGQPHALDLRISVGSSVFPAHATRAERLLWCADMALLEAKREGGNRFVLCDPTRIHRGSAL
jgi:diguanylate cyclase (GGDEF)-like protein